MGLDPTAPTAFTPGKGTLAAKKKIREHVAFLDIDRPLYPDHNTMMALTKSLDILTAVEAEVGELATY